MTIKRCGTTRQKDKKNKRDKQTKRTKREIYIVMSVLHYCDDAAITREIKVKMMIMFKMLKMMMMMMIKTVMVIGKTLRGGVDPDINVKMPSRTKGGITETVIKVIDKMNINCRRHVTLTSLFSQVCDDCGVEFCNGRHCPLFEYDSHCRTEPKVKVLFRKICIQRNIQIP